MNINSWVEVIFISQGVLVKQAAYLKAVVSPYKTVVSDTLTRIWTPYIYIEHKELKP